MVRSKETFERWNTKKRPATAASPRVVEETRIKEMQRTRRTDSENASGSGKKGMKHTALTPNAFPVSTLQVVRIESPTNQHA